MITGRPPGTFGKRRRRVDTILAKHGFDALEEKILLVKQLKAMWNAEVSAPQDAAVLDIGTLHLRVLEAICQYAYPQLRSVEIADAPDGFGLRAPSADQIAMIREIAEKLGYEFRPMLDSQPTGNGAH